jgi:two-component system chemotaxis response regulator CheB
MRMTKSAPWRLVVRRRCPQMDGLETLRRVRREYPGLRVTMFSILTQRGAGVTLEALTLGADDYVTKASNEGSVDRSMARLREEELVPKIKQFFNLLGRTQTVHPNDVQALKGPQTSIAAPQRLRRNPESLQLGFQWGGRRLSERSSRICPWASRSRFFWSSTCPLSSPIATRASSRKMPAPS